MVANTFCAQVLKDRLNKLKAELPKNLVEALAQSESRMQREMPRRFAKIDERRKLKAK